MAGRGHGEGGTSGHWASDTTVENPHGRGTYVMALEYHPREDLAVTAGENGSFNLWGLKRNTSTVESLAATAAGVEGGGKGDDNPKTHWACTLSVR